MTHNLERSCADGDMHYTEFCITLLWSHATYCLTCSRSRHILYMFKITSHMHCYMFKSTHYAHVEGYISCFDCTEHYLSTNPCQRLEYMKQQKGKSAKIQQLMIIQLVWAAKGTRDNVMFKCQLRIEKNAKGRHLLSYIVSLTPQEAAQGKQRVKKAC